MEIVRGSPLPELRSKMGHRKSVSEEKINVRLREVTAELRKLRTELEEDIRAQRRAPFTRLLNGNEPTRFGARHEP